MMIDYKAELNSEQYEIAMNAQGACLILAGPGSGKTRTIIYKICRLIEQGENPENLLLLTFTNKAAHEMRLRAEALIGTKAKSIVAGTFHSFANIYLRKYASYLGIDSRFTIIDESDANSLVKKAIAQHEFAGELKAENQKQETKEKKKSKKRVLEAAELKHIISLSKLRIESIEKIINLFYPGFKENIMQIGEMAKTYEKLKKEANSLDFDDLLLYMHALLRESDELRERISSKFSSIFVDEFQDTDRLQGEILSLLYKEGRTKNFIVVGDEAQSIYSFRGADIRNILDFQARYKAKVFYLLNNYRSSKPIISLINESIKNSTESFGKKLEASNSFEAEMPVLFRAYDRKEEAWVILEQIKEHLKNKETTAVLFRAAYMAAELELALSKNGITYDMRGGVKFFEQKHIKDMTSLLRAHANKRDHVAVKRLLMLFPGIGEKKAEKLADGIAASGLETFAQCIAKEATVPKIIAEICLRARTPADMLDSFYEEFYSACMKEIFENFSERETDVEALIGAAAQHETTDSFLESFVLETFDNPSKKNRHYDVVLSTIHQAKGLEWDNVYIICLAESMFPPMKATYMEEERRLFYVAASRAKKRLCMSYPGLSGRFYTIEEMQLSRFIAELPESCYVAK